MGGGTEQKTDSQTWCNSHLLTTGERGAFEEERKGVSRISNLREKKRDDIGRHVCQRKCGKPRFPCFPVKHF